MIENKISLTGVLYKKYSRHWTSEKKGKKTEGDFWYYILEHTEHREGKRKTEEGEKNTYFTERNLIQIQLGYGMSPDDYSEGDFIEVRFSIRGKELKTKSGEPWYKTELVAYFIRFADIDRKEKKSETVYKPIKEVFTPPDPDNEENYGDPLPF